MRRVRAVCLASSVGLLSLGSPAFADVPVLQIESRPPENPDTGYAPIDFAGATTQAGMGAFSGINFNALANTNNTFSAHASVVGQNFYGTGTAAHAFVSNVYVDEADRFLASVVKTQMAGSSASAPAPLSFGNGVRVSNSSWVGTFAPDHPNADGDAIRRIDYMINRDDVTFVATAVAATSGDFKDTNLAWAARNAVAVRGDEGVLPFTLSGTSPGKTHADVWGSGTGGGDEGSYVTGAVSGYAASLVGTAQGLGATNAQHNQVIRSLLMTGADKTVASVNNGTWADETPNHLSVKLGAGKVRYGTSLEILNAGQKSVANVIGSSIASEVATTGTKGWSYGTSVAGADQAIVFYAPGGISDVTATLNWNVTQPDALTPGNINTLAAATVFPDLNLELRRLTPNVVSFDILAPLNDPGLRSDSTGASQDNIEHLYSTNDLGAGYYAFIIHGDASRTTDYGFSYSITPAPEPGGVMVLAMGAGLAMVRRRRK
jgi:hypothetical protein